MVVAVLAGVCLLPNQAAAQQVSIEKTKGTTVYTPATLTLTADTSTINSCAEVPVVHLIARATSPDGNPIRYRWSTNNGHINGDGASVNWDLAGLAPGYYKASVETITGTSDNECQAFSSTNVLVTPCPPAPPVCPTVSISCPTDIAIDRPLTFSANLSGGSGSIAPIYNWTVSAGTIIDGQGTSSIKIDTAGLAGQTVRATLSMGGYTLDCSASCAVQMPVPIPSSRKFDEFPAISRNDEKARLDNLAVELQNDPTATAYVIVHPGRNSKSGDVQRHTSRVVDYLVNTRAIDSKRIVTLVGATQEELMVELWLRPQGATPPRP
ncbi:MAG: hypothetical protein C5B55_08955 [Blastocatellia bacterium]|nr:MAG: hypothetical protein C5B55_08955 [Blastocatellia bacterium]